MHPSTLNTGVRHTTTFIIILYRKLLSMNTMILLAVLFCPLFVGSETEAFVVTPRTRQIRGNHVSLELADFSSLTVPETNTLLVPVFASSAVPYGIFVYFMNKLTTFPKGATIGFAWVFLLGLFAGPAEFFTQQTYGVSFFDCDWIHGMISSLFATGYTVANISLLEAIRDNDMDGRDDPGYATALRYCVVITSVIVAISLSEYLRGYGVHSPHWYGLLDLSIASVHGEPANALSVATWFNHILEISQFQMLLRFIILWAKHVSGNPSMKKLGWSLVPLQFGNVAIITFHMFYNQVAPLYLVFGILLFLGNAIAAFTAWQLAIDSPTDSIRELPPPPEMDSPPMYAVKSLSVALVFCYLVKYGSLVVDLPSHLDVTTAAAVTLPASLFVLLDVQRLASSYGDGNNGKSESA